MGRKNSIAHHFKYRPKRLSAERSNIRIYIAGSACNSISLYFSYSMLRSVYEEDDNLFSSRASRARRGEENALDASNVRGSSGDGWIKAIEKHSDDLIRDAMERFKYDGEYEAIRVNDVEENDSFTQSRASNPRYMPSISLASQLERQLDDFGYSDETSESNAKDIVRRWAEVHEEASSIKARATRDARIERASAYDNNRKEGGKLEKTLRKKVGARNPVATTSHTIDPQKRIEHRHKLVAQQRQKQRPETRRIDQTL